MPTNILSLPMMNVASTVKTNESWRDGIAFTISGSITSQAAPGNSGNGYIASPSNSFGSFVGDYILTLTSATTFRVTDPDGYVIGAGTVGSLFSSSGVSFTLTQNSIPFAVGDSFTLTILPKPLDITGIRFLMMLRRAVGDATILLSISTDDGTMVNGGPSGVLGWAVPYTTMSKIPPSPDGSPYVYDVLAQADGDQLCCADGKAIVLAAITTPPG